MKKLLIIALILTSFVSVSQAQMKPTRSYKLSKNQDHMKRYMNNILYENNKELAEYIPFKHGNVYQIGEKTFIYKANRYYFEVTIYHSVFHERSGISKTMIDEIYYLNQKGDAVEIMAQKWANKYKAKGVKIPYWLYK